jgi:branched-chain amino acid transport system permease protein
LAIHDDEDVAEVNGVPTFALKMAAFALSSFLAGMMGSIHALYVSYVTVSETFNINVPWTVVLMSILGGARHWAGPTLGAILITLLLNAFTDGSSALVGRVVIGLILTLSVLLMPNGIWGSLSARLRGKKVQIKGDPLSEQSHADPRGRDLLSERTAELAIKGVTPVGTKVVLEVKGLTKQFFAIKALGGIDLKLYEGEILGLLGPNGSGKSTFINVVTGHFSASSGEIQLLGRDVSHLSAHEIRKSGISRTYQIPRPFNGLTVLQNVVLSAQYGGSGASESQGTEQALQWLEFTGLSDKAADLPDALNLHQRKFLELARALAARPQVLLLDEVLSGLTPSEIDLAVQTIRLIRQRGTSIVFVEHVMSAVMALSDRLVVLDQGMVIASGAPKEVMNDPHVVRAYLGDKVEGE